MSSYFSNTPLVANGQQTAIIDARWIETTSPISVNPSQHSELLADVELQASQTDGGACWGAAVLYRILDFSHSVQAALMLEDGGEGGGVWSRQYFL